MLSPFDPTMLLLKQTKILIILNFHAFVYVSSKYKCKIWTNPKTPMLFSSLLEFLRSCHVTGRRVKGIGENPSTDYGFLSSLIYVAT